MIDYEKLKLAHELTRKLPYDSYHFDCWCCTGIESGFFYVLTFEDNKNLTHEFESENIDDLIAKLQEITQPKYKYKAGQKVWRIDGHEPIQLTICDIDHYEPVEYLDENGAWWCEEQLYPSREALIEDQLEYWYSLKIKAISSSKTCPKCGMQRVSDGMCWHMGCDYKESPKFEGEIKGFNTLKCAHESDERTYENEIIEDLKRCKKCREFYR